MGSNFVQDLKNGLFLHQSIGMCSILNEHQNICLGSLFKCRPKCINKGVWQVLNKPDGISHYR